MSKYLIFLAFFIVFSAGSRAQAPDPAKKTDIAAIYLAKDDGTGQAGPEAEEFLTTDVPIYCVVQLSSGETATVRMNLVAVSVAGVRPETRVVSTSYTTKDLQDRVNFTGRPAGRWVVGRYRADIFVNDTLAGSRDFVIQKGVGTKDAVKPVEKPAAPSKSRLARKVVKS